MGVHLCQVMMTQLAVRHIMAAAGCASINIICEKVAFQVQSTAEKFCLMNVKSHRRWQHGC